MKIIHLINDTYQVVSEDEKTVYFQGSLKYCEKLMKKTEFSFRITLIKSE